MLTKKEILEILKDKEDSDLFDFKEVTDKKIRTYRQVKYYWGVMIRLVSEKTWDSPLEVNENNKILFKKETFTDLDTKEFEIYMGLIREYYKHHLSNSDYIFNIPKPNEYY